jgi:hypothetical protein
MHKPLQLLIVHGVELVTQRHDSCEMDVIVKMLC